MGHREDLLAAAKRCLRERGYARITARDLVAESGTNLASIGYHFGSKEELLSAALIEMVGDWADNLEASLETEVGAAERQAVVEADADADAGDGRPADPLGRFRAVWDQVLASYPDSADDWRDGLEALSQARHSPAVRQRLADGYEEAREALAPWFHERPPADPAEARALGGFYLALLSGVMIQRGIDPERAPDAADLTRAMRGIVAEFGGGAEDAGDADAADAADADARGGTQAPSP